MFGLGPLEIAGILIIVIILFGVGRLTKIGGELGGGIRAFRKGIQGDDEEKPDENKPAEAPPASEQDKKQ